MLHRSIQICQIISILATSALRIRGREHLAMWCIFSKANAVMPLTMVAVAKCAIGQTVSSARPSFTKNMKPSGMSSSVTRNNQGGRTTPIPESRRVVMGTRSTSSRMGHAGMKLDMGNRRTITMSMHLSNLVQKEKRIVSDPEGDIIMCIKMLTAWHVKHTFAQEAQVLPQAGIVTVATGWTVIAVRPSSANPRT